MQINGPSQLHGAQQIAAPHMARSASPSAAAGTSATSDEVTISDTARLVEMAQQAPEVRQDRIDQIRAQIANGTYETSDKLNTAVERLLDEIG